MPLAKDSRRRAVEFQPGERFVSPRRAATFLNVGMDAMYKALKAGHVPSVRVGERNFKVPVAALERLARGESA